MNMRCFVLFLLFLLLAVPVGTMAGDHQQCQLCGMDLNKYTHVRYTVTTTGQQQITTCGVQCGLLLQLNLGDAFSSATATTLLGHRVVPATDAWYVYKSRAVTDMGPGFIAFASRDYATRFVKGFGGKVLNYQQALDAVRGGFQ